MITQKQSPAGSAGQNEKLEGDMPLINNSKDSEFKADKQMPLLSYESLKTDAERLSNEVVTPDTIYTSEFAPKNGITAEELLKMKVSNIPFIVDGLMQKVGLAALAGSSDTGKSAFLRNLCMSICAGKSRFLDFNLNSEHKSAIYVSTEDDELSTSYLLNRQNEDMRVSPSDLAGLRFVFDTDNLIDTLDNMLTEKQADIVVIDAFGDLYGKSPNDASQVRCFLNSYSQLAQKYKCLIVFLHHCGKRTEDGTPSKHNLLGSQGFEAKMRLVLELRSDMAEVNYKHLCCVKGNYLPSDVKNESYKLRFTDNLTFTNTGERTPFGDLKKTEDRDEDIAKYEMAVSLQAQGLTLEDIAKKIGYKNKSSVSRLLQKHSNS